MFWSAQFYGKEKYIIFLENKIKTKILKRKNHISEIRLICDALWDPRRIEFNPGVEKNELKSE